MDQKSNKSDLSMNITSDSKSDHKSDEKSQSKSSFLTKSDPATKANIDPHSDPNYSLKPNVMSPSIDPPSHYNAPPTSSVDSKHDWKSNSNMDPRTEENLRMDPKTDTPLKPTTVTPSRTDYSHELKTGSSTHGDEMTTPTGSLKKIDNFLDPNFSRAIKLDPTLSSEMKPELNPEGQTRKSDDVTAPKKSDNTKTSMKINTNDKKQNTNIEVTDRNTFSTTPEEKTKECRACRYVQGALFGGGALAFMGLMKTSPGRWLIASPMFAGALYSFYRASKTE